MKYSYYNPTQIQFGKEQIKSISNFISKEQKVLIVYGGVIVTGKRHSRKTQKL